MENLEVHKLQIDISRKDYIYLNMYYVFKKGLRKRIKILLLMVSVLTFISVSFSSFSIYHFLINFGYILVIFGVLYFISLFVGVLSSGLLPLKKGHILGKRTIEFNNEGLCEATDSSSTIQKWEGVKSIEMNRDYFFIFVDNMAAYIIPKRCFSNKQELDDFDSYIHMKIRGFNTNKGLGDLA